MSRELYGLATIIFAKSEEIDRLAISYNNFGMVVFKTLGQRLTELEIDKVSQYRTVGVVWRFEDEGGVYGEVP